MERRQSRNEYVIQNAMERGAYNSRGHRAPVQQKSSVNLITIFIWAVGLIFVGGLIQRAYKYFAPFM